MSDHNTELPEVPEDEKKLHLISPTELLERGSNFYDHMGFAVFRRFVNACLHGAYVYKKNSGDLFVGSATFYGLLSIIPITSCATFLLGLYKGDMANAHANLFQSLYQIIPKTSHTLVDQVAALTQAHLNNTPLTFLNLALLTWATVSFFSTLVAGLLKVTNTKESGGAVMSTLRALSAVLALGAVLLFAFELGEHGSLTRAMIGLFPKTSYADEIISAIARWQVFTMISSGLMVTMLYRWLFATPFYACVEGATAFLGGFLALKSFYWIYLHYNEASTQALFGGFAPLVVSILWGYFAITAFFIGACVASLPRQKAILSKIPNIPNSWDDAA